jgi:hypothetical protein
MDFLSTFEIVSGKLLASIRTNCKLRAEVMDCIITNPLVIEQWENICECSSQANSLDLLHSLVRKYSMVRCKAYIQNIRRKADSASTKVKSKASASLRQGLALNSK